VDDQPGTKSDAQPGQGAPYPDQETVTRAMTEMAEIGERSQRLVSDFLARQAEQFGQGGIHTADSADPMNIGQAFMEMTSAMMANPGKMVQAQITLWEDYMELWKSATERLMGQNTPATVEPEKGDRRFRDDAWNEIEVFNFIKQSYLLTSRWMQSTVRDVEGLDDETAKKVDFFTRQFTNALSPSNFVMTNPEVLRATAEQSGENLINGLKNLLGDLERGSGKLKISMTDEDAFDVGDNVATTPGKVIYRNDLMELVQYAPTTDKVCQKPLLMITPWINKFYILDLRPENSFIKWAVDQGHTVFVTSWVNPDESHANKTFDDYMIEGPLAALDAIEAATGEKQVNALGYCIGGTLLACTLAYIEGGKAKKTKKWLDRITSATFLTTMVDFEEAGEMSVFIDEDQISTLEESMNERGYLEGSAMANTFNMMRDNDLIWSFVVNNYLLGKDPFPFDLLYWNADTTRMPAAMHSFYLRKMYLENQLVKPGGISLDGVKIDLGKIKTPSYLLSTRDDHIAPWMSTYAATGLYSGPVKFVLAASGHIAGVVNPPVKEKYCYWTNPKNPADPEKWLEDAPRTEGSWWPDWDTWLKSHDGKQVAARKPGGGKLKPLADAPGDYVRMQSD